MSGNIDIDLSQGLFQKLYEFLPTNSIIYIHYVYGIYMVKK